MRWLVEVTSLGKTDTESLHIESDSWQKALQLVRAQRGESSPMSGFSIELLEDGCRALDPSSRLRYVLRRAADAPAVATAAEAPPAALSPPRPSSIPGANRQAPPRGPVPAAASAPLTFAADTASSSDHEVIFKREEEATDAMPLTYREYAFLVSSGASEAAAEALLQSQLVRIRSSLERSPPGKLVHLGVFDEVVQGRPRLPPLATLTWKDWRAEPSVGFPRKQQAQAQVLGAARENGPSGRTTAVQAQVSAISGVPIRVVPREAPPPAVLPAPVPPNAGEFPASRESPRVPPSVEAERAAEPSPVHRAPPAVSVAAPSDALAEAVSPQVASPARTRVRGEDLIADLFEAMHDLHFLRDAVEGGYFCLGLSMEKLPSRAGIVHLYDIDRRSFLVTATRGAGARALLLRRHPESDAVLSAAMRKRSAVVMTHALAGDKMLPDRYAELGGLQSLVIAPVMQSGRFLGAIELVNPLDGQPFTEAEGNALTYIAEQFAEFVATRGIVTDPERISVIR